jgi:hypothetical protein
MIQKLTTAFLAVLLTLFSAYSQPGNNLHQKILGSWRFENGKYMYFDSSHHKLKESDLTELKGMTVVVSPRTARIVYPDKEEYTGNYSLFAQNGKQYVTLRLQDEAISYQITAISNSVITVQARHNIQFFVDGDEEKKASYSVVVMNFRRR